MAELRLIPSAALLWVVTLIIIGTRTPWWALALVFAVGVGVAFWDVGLALTNTVIGVLGVLVTSIRAMIVDTTTIHPMVTATAASYAHRTNTGWIQQFRIDDYPVTLPVITHQRPDIPIGTLTELHGNPIATTSFGLGNTLFLATTAHPVGSPDLLHQWGTWVRETFAHAVAAHTSGDAAALIPAMVLGDTTGQTPEFTQRFVATGLTHLSAVSGSNVALVTTAAVLLVAHRSPRTRAMVAALALLGYVVIVGPDASVLRAAATGIVGLIVMLSATTKAPSHTLALVVIGLILYDSSLAAHYGFALSVAATGGIIAAVPPLHTLIGRTGLPNIIGRALAVALAAHLVTMPIVALMSNRISVIAVAANLLAAPAVAPITILGLVAAILSLLPGGLETIPLAIIRPLAHWIGLVATGGAALPGATIALPAALAPAWAALAAAWTIWLIYRQHFRILVGVVLLLLFAPGIPMLTGARRIDPHTLITYTVPTKDHLITLDKTGGIPPDAQLILIERPPPSGRRQAHRPRPTVTRAGVPVVVMGVDVDLYEDGTQHAADGSF